MMRFPFIIWTDERGNSVIEVALVAPVLATLIVGSVDISRACSAKLQVEQAAQRTVELVQRSEYETTDNSILEADAVAAVGAGATATVASWLECNHDGVHLDFDTGACSSDTDPYAKYFQVTVQQSFTPLFGTRFFPGANTDGTVTLRATAGIRTQ